MRLSLGLEQLGEKGSEALEELPLQGWYSAAMTDPAVSIFPLGFLVGSVRRCVRFFVCVCVRAIIRAPEARS